MFELSENDIPADSTLPVEGQSAAVIPSNNESVVEPAKMFEYQASGKTVSEDLDTILKRASQGYNYAQHVAEHKTNVDAFTQEKEQHLAKFGTWKQYDEYAIQNPEWANYVKSQWESRESFGQTPVVEGHQDQSIHPEVKSFMDEYRQNQSLQREQAEDSALNDQIKSVQEQFPEFDLSFSNPETGKTAEMQVIEHAKAHGINSFKAAFKDLMFDEIVNKRVTASKEAAAKELAERTKQGFISTSDTSLSGLGLPQKANSGSLHDVVLNGAAELGIPL